MASNGPRPATDYRPWRRNEARRLKWAPGIWQPRYRRPLKRFHHPAVRPNCRIRVKPVSQVVAGAAVNLIKMVGQWFSGARAWWRQW